MTDALSPSAPRSPLAVPRQAMSRRLVPTRSPRVIRVVRIGTLALMVGLPSVMAAQPSAAKAPAAAPTETRTVTAGAGLPLGERSLPEKRAVKQVGRGVVWTSINRGDKAAEASTIRTTTKGPWSVNVLTINPRVARGRLLVTAGANLTSPERTSALVGSVGAAVGVNGGFFAIHSKTAPGDPVGLSILDGVIASEPGVGPAATAMLVDARTKRLGIDTYTWTGTVMNRKTKRTSVLSGINRPPVVPAGCEEGDDQSECEAPGQVVAVTTLFGATTPSGPGTEVVVNARGCVQQTRTPRGGDLPRGYTAYQATGRAAPRLSELAGEDDCLTLTQSLRDSVGRRVILRPGLYAVNGRRVLVKANRNVAGIATSGFAGRNPRTIAGRTRGGSVMLVTIDGRRGTSVGATLPEAAGVARSLGMYDAINLDGGGSTTMVVGGNVVNKVSDPAERPVGDALVYVP